MTILSNNKLLFIFFLHSNRYCIVFFQLEYGDTSIFQFLHTCNYSNSIESKDFFSVKYYNHYSASHISYISVCHILRLATLHLRTMQLCRHVSARIIFNTRFNQVKRPVSIFYWKLYIHRYFVCSSNCIKFSIFVNIRIYIKLEKQKEQRWTYNLKLNFETSRLTRPGKLNVKRILCPYNFYILRDYPLQ